MILVFEKVFVGRLERDHGFGEIVETETVGSLPDTALVFVADLDHDLR